MSARKISHYLTEGDITVEKSYVRDTPRVAVIGDGGYPNYLIRNLVDHDVNVVALLTNEDPPGKLTGIVVKDLRNKQLVEVMRSLVEEEGVDYFLMAFYGERIPKGIVDEYQGRLINLHPSLLPLFRGREPIENMLDAGVTQFGVTLHLVDEGWDTGEVIAQANIEFLQGNHRKQALGFAYKKAVSEGARIFAYALENMDRITPIPQSKLLDEIMERMLLPNEQIAVTKRKG